jgi:hypothetical protein
MNANPSSRFSLLMGETFIACMSSVGIHETGHYLTNSFQGVPDMSISKDYNIQFGDPCVVFGTPLRWAFNLSEYIDHHKRRIL